MIDKRLTLIGCVALAACSVAIAQSNTPASSGFALKDGDHVTFYGDSITEQREYTADVEAFVVTRFPHWKIAFNNAGVGGDKVSGGWAGPVDLRIKRDVIDEHPNMITIMLGMNDGYYRAGQPGILTTYSEGYRHIVDEFQKDLPQAQITLVQPSPYDDVTRAPMFDGGYNGVLLQYSSFLADLSREKKTLLTDFNGPVTAVLTTMKQQSPELAEQLVPDRVHPQQGGHWLMAESLLKTWHAPALVSSVSLDVTPKVPTSDAKNAKVTELNRPRKSTNVSWTTLEEALPLPLPDAALDPVLALAVKNSDIVQALDQETLTVKGLGPGTYDLKIDAVTVSSFTADELAAGVNLATLDTPMLEQARLVAYDTEKVNSLEGARFDIIARSLEGESSKTAAALGAAYPKAVDRQRNDAAPKPHHFELQPQTVAK
jgi:lysophospholipase L1-like esterase